MDPYSKHVHDLLKHLAITQCGYCDNISHMELVASYDAVGSIAGDIWELVCCPACAGVNLRQIDVHWGAEPEIGKRAVRVVYPPTGKNFTNVPRSIEKAYQDALEVRHKPNSFVIALRRVIEGVCLDRGASKGNLKNKLTNLAEKKEIPIQLAEMADKLRLFGNIGAHHFGEGEITSAETAILDDLCVAILEYVYVLPGRIDKLDLKLKELKNK